MPDTMAVQVPAGSAVQRPSTWVRGPVWDGVWMLNALWLVPIALWLAHGYSDPEASPLDVFYFGLTALFWIGHRLGSTWLAYCTEAYRPLLRSEPVRFVLLPLLVTVACFVVFLPPDDAFPWTRWERFVGMAILDYALVTYHFAAQHFGALSLYRTRAERARCAQTRRHDRIFALGVGGALVFLADILAGAVAYPDLWINRWLIPALGCIEPGCNPRSRHVGVVRRDSPHAGCGGARTAPLAAARALHPGTRGDGRHRSSAPEPVSLPRNLDCAALDPRNGSRFPDSRWRAGTRKRCCPACLSRIECPALGCPAGSRSCFSPAAAAL